MRALFYLTLTASLLALACAATQPAHAVRPRSERMAGPLFADVTDVLDGDTLAVRVQVWIGHEVVTDVRIAGIDAPELRGHCDSERQKAQEARKTLRRLLKNNRAVLSDIRLEKYAGRVLATVKATDGTVIGDYLVKAGLARPYGGNKRGSWC